jgi:V/A-type H+-transporting ATPase subunit A
MSFNDKDSARRFFQRLTQTTRDWNRVDQNATDFLQIERQLEQMLAEVSQDA